MGKIEPLREGELETKVFRSREPVALDFFQAAPPVEFWNPSSSEWQCSTEIACPSTASTLIATCRSRSASAFEAFRR